MNKTREKKGIEMQGIAEGVIRVFFEEYDCLFFRPGRIAHQEIMFHDLIVVPGTGRDLFILLPGKAENKQE